MIDTQKRTNRFHMITTIEAIVTMATENVERLLGLPASLSSLVSQQNNKNAEGDLELPTTQAFAFIIKVPMQ